MFKQRLYFSFIKYHALVGKNTYTIKIMYKKTCMVLIYTDILGPNHTYIIFSPKTVHISCFLLLFFFFFQNIMNQWDVILIDHQKLFCTHIVFLYPWEHLLYCQQANLTLLYTVFYTLTQDTDILEASVAQLDAPSNWRPGGRGFNPRRGRQHSFVEIDREIFSTVILSLPLIQEGQLSVSGERMCTILVNRFAQ